jgi:hypothetical protein
LRRAEFGHQDVLYTCSEKQRRELCKFTEEWSTGLDGADGSALKPQRSNAVNTSSIELLESESVVIKGFENEIIDVGVEQLETRIVPESLAGFLE